MGITITGFTCSQCGAWVPEGNLHICYSTPGNQQLSRIIELLQKITALLEEKNGQ